MGMTDAIRAELSDAECDAIYYARARAIQAGELPIDIHGRERDRALIRSAYRAGAARVEPRCIWDGCDQDAVYCEGHAREYADGLHDPHGRALTGETATEHFDRVQAGAAREGSAESVGAEPISEMVRTAPPRIWLQVSDDDYHADEPFPDCSGDEITWCQDSVLACQVEYVRADLARPSAAGRAEPLGWICTHAATGKVRHFGKADGWRLDIVMESDDLSMPHADKYVPSIATDSTATPESRAEPAMEPVATGERILEFARMMGHPIPAPPAGRADGGERETPDDLVRRLRDDHLRGCEGRTYTCTCGYALLTDEAADAIEQLLKER